jgi:MFS family permease
VRPAALFGLPASFFAVSLASAFFSTAHFLFFPATPLFLEQLGGSSAEVGFVFGAAAFAALLARPFVGRLTQRSGPKAMLTGGIALVVFAAGGYAAATGVLMVLAMRLLSGVYSAMAMTAGSTYVADVAPPARRGTAFGLFMSASMLSQVIGGPLSLAVLDGAWLKPLDGALAALLGRASYDLNFYSLFLLSGLTALVGLACTRFMRPTGDGKRRAVAAGWSLGTMFNRQALFPAVVSVCVFGNQIAVFAFLPLMAKRYDLGNIGFYFAFQALALMAVRFVSGPLSDRHGSAVVVVPGIALMAAGAALLAFARSPVFLYAAGLVWGLGFGATQAALTTYLVDRIPPEVRPTALSTFTLGTDIGIGLGGIFLGTLLQATDFTVLYLVAGLLAGAGIVIFGFGHRLAWSGPELRART